MTTSYILLYPYHVKFESSNYMPNAIHFLIKDQKR